MKVYEGLLDDPEVTIEGGDVLVADKETVLVGVSQRTNEKGAEPGAFKNTAGYALYRRCGYTDIISMESIS